MKDPKRLVQVHRRDLGGKMLRSARLDEPPRGAQERALVVAGSALAGATAASAANAAGVVAGTAASGAASGSSASGVVPAVMTWKIVGIVGAVGAVAIGAAVRLPATLASHAATEPAAASAPSPPLVTPPPAPVASYVTRVTAHEEAPPPNDSIALVPSGQPLPLPTTVRLSSPSPSPSPPAASADSALASELGLLDEARAAMAASDPKRAGSVLDAYAARFPRGTLVLEAAMLRIEAMNAEGNREGARALATRLLVEHPTSPYTDRLRSWQSGGAQ